MKFTKTIEVKNIFNR